MKLTSFRITDYRCVDDSGEIPVDPKITCLVGKNESGKTTVLQALRRANPLHAARFDLVEDYPRKRLRQYEREQRRTGAPPARVVIAEFTLDDDDVRAVEEAFAPGVVPERKVIVEAGYGASKVTVPASEAALVAHLSGGTAWARRISDFPNIDELVAALGQAQAEDVEARDLAGRLKPYLGGVLGGVIWQRLLERRAPKFMYFDDYSVMRGSAPIQSLADGTALREDGLRTLKELLDLAGTSAAELLSDANYEHHKANLEATGNDITHEVFEYWRQNPDLEVEFDVHRSQAAGQNAQSTFHVRIKNRRHGVTVPFDERSRGFVWFFSFLVAFNKVIEQGVPVIILLDEPGLNLHGKAQADLLRFIEERLAPHHQVIYTTHSPFMVDPQHLERVRTVEDVANQGTRVTADALTTDADTLFPLQAALGYDVAQSLFVGPNCLLVEGPSDLLYLQAMSRIAAARGGPSLDERWVITPVGGADKLAAFVALMGGKKLNLAVVMDIAKRDQQRIDNLIARRLMDASRILPISTFVPQGDADIEDLFSPTFYVDVAKTTLPPDHAAKLGTLPPGPRVVKRIEQALGSRFDHYAVAVRTIARLDAAVDDETLRRFGALFEAVNRLLPRLEPSVQVSR